MSGRGLVARHRGSGSQAVLSASDRRVAVQALVSGVGEVAAAERVAVLLLKTGADGEVVLYSKASADSAVIESNPPIWEADRTWLGLAGTGAESVQVAARLAGSYAKPVMLRSPDNPPESVMSFWPTTISVPNTTVTWSRLAHGNTAS